MVKNKNLSSIIKEYQSGIGSYRIAKKYDVNPCTIREWLKQAGIPMMRRGRKDMRYPSGEMEGT